MVFSSSISSCQRERPDVRDQDPLDISLLVGFHDEVLVLPLSTLECAKDSSMKA